MNSSYTDRMEEAYWDQWDMFDAKQDDATPDDVINFLNDEETFRTFGEGLINLMQKKYGDIVIENPRAFLKQMCIKTGVNIEEIGSRNTLKDWFSGERKPKKGEADRYKMFAIAFALEFNPEETAELFHKVYLDRAFNFRNAEEIVFYYCLSQNKPWVEAKRLISMVGFDGDYEDRTIYTSELEAGIKNISTEQGLLDFIKKHSHNLSLSSVTADSKIEEYIEKSKWAARIESYMEQNAEDFEKRSRDKMPINLLYEVITRIKTSGKDGTLALIKKARLPHEIKSRFPTSASLGIQETHEDRRKVLILLYFYTAWFTKQWGKIPKNQEEFEKFRPNYDFDYTVNLEDYTSHLDYLLFECGFSPLYYGNPYDWFFMFCSLSKTPLDCFREFLAEVLPEE